MIGSIGEFILQIVCLKDVREASQTIRSFGSHVEGYFCAIRGVDLNFDFVIMVCYRTFDAFIHSGLPNSS